MRTQQTAQSHEQCAHDLTHGDVLASLRGMARRRNADSVALSKRVQREFGERLRLARRNCHRGRVDQSALAKALDVSRTSISNIERGQHRVFLDQVYAAAHALDISVGELLPPLVEVMPNAVMVTAPSASVTAQSVQTVSALARTIQERAARDELPNSATRSTRRS